MNSTDRTYKAPGDVVSTVAQECWKEIEANLAQLKKSETLVLDLRASRIIDSVGLNVIVKAIKVADSIEAKVKILVGTESVKRICIFTRLDKKAEVIGP
ncbi:hypothetical protein VDG1235_2829 [Verrucomicrobiia bacterium DG1235]|nr:hypothetical protein VDG1235_2829 [Verrucomicrobiae bacterium DG1235]